MCLLVCVTAASFALHFQIPCEEHRMGIFLGCIFGYHLKIKVWGHIKV